MTENGLSRVLAAFGINNRIIEYKEPVTGNVNRTYRVITENADGKRSRLIVQRLNGYAYDEPEKLMQNAALISEWMRKKNAKPGTVKFYKSLNGYNFWRAEDGDYWRVYDYIDGVTFASTDDLNIIENTGRAFGRFQQIMADFDERQLYLTIPDFHNTKRRYELLEEAYGKNICGRRSRELEESYDWLMSVKDRACILTAEYEQNKLPLRVCHNDTKINNVLFDENSGEAIAIIDLDTVMPGLLGHDFGDAVRSVACGVSADKNHYFDPEKFRAFTKGFLSLVKESLSENEINTLCYGPFCMTAELAVRYLTDYLMGDKYFKISYDRQNLDKAKQRIMLAKDMLNYEAEIRSFISEISRLSCL